MSPVPAGRLDRPLHRGRLARFIVRVSAVVLLSGCGSAVVNPVTGATERSVLNETEEVQAGRQAHQQVLDEYGRYADVALQAYVDQVGQRLAARSHRADLRWTFTVLDTPMVNAFALPGGYVYVTRGLLAYLGSEAELAGVIGHEIGHVSARHGAQQVTRQQRASVGLSVANKLGELLEGLGLSGANERLQHASQGLAQRYVSAYSREQELQADRLGAEYLVRNRYDPRNMIDVIGVLKGQERFAAERVDTEGPGQAGEPGWLSSHPSNDQRLEDLRRIAASYPAEDWSDDGRQRYLRALEGLVFGEGRGEGVTRGRHFFHELRGIAITAPQGWRVLNTSDALSLVSPQQDVALVLRSLPLDASASHDDILARLLPAVQGRRETLSLHGMPATHFESLEPAEAAGRLPPPASAPGGSPGVSLTLVTGPGRRHYVLQRAARDDVALRRSAVALAQAEASFRPLSAAERRLARPWQLRLRTLPRGGFAELAKTSPLPAPALAQLRLLNGLYSDAGELRPGDWVKIVQ